MVDRSTFHEPGSGDVAAERRRLVGIVERLEAIERELDGIAEHRKALAEQAQHLAKRRKALLAEARDPQLSLAVDDEEPLDDTAVRLADELAAQVMHDDEVEAKPATMLPPKRRAPKASKRAPKAAGLDPRGVRWPDEAAGGDA